MNALVGQPQRLTRSPGDSATFERRDLERIRFSPEYCRLRSIRTSALCKCFEARCDRHSDTIPYPIMEI